MDHYDDDQLIGRVLARRDVLRVLGGATVMMAALPGAMSRLRSIGPSRAHAQTVPTCIVRPEQTEGPYFVDELLERSDIRSDPTTGAVSAGVPLTLAFVVSRLDGTTCSPFAGAVVDVWHCDSQGLYSDVAANGTVGRKFLRGYQVTDADGAATFVTIYPGWYQGRTVHIHFKIRTAADETLEFTSQLFFDDALTDAVYAQAPYASRGTRSTRNATDGIYAGGGSELLLDVAADGAGGYVATFAIGIETSGTGSGTTTTTVAGGTYTTIDACLASLATTLPAQATATSRAARRTAQKLRRRLAQATRLATRAARRSGAAQLRDYGKARTALDRLLVIARLAQSAGTLDASLTAIDVAANAVLGLLPA